MIPAKNEEQSVGRLYSEIKRSIHPITRDYEIIFIDDGSTDNTFKELCKLRKRSKKIKVIKHRGNWGKSIALRNGFEAATGELIFTLDADLQDNPVEIPKFIKKLNDGYDLVTGWKRKRYDPTSKVVPSRILNHTVSFLTGVKIHDTNCGFKLYRREVVKNLALYGELYRFIPILAAKQNFRVGEVVVRHRKRRFGKTKFGWERNIKGFLDLLTIIFLTGYMYRPGHFFGTLGIGSFAGGFAIGVYIAYLRITTGSIQFRHPLLFLGMLLMIVGVQLISTGLLAEMVIHRQKKNYRSFIEREL